MYIGDKNDLEINATKLVNCMQYRLSLRWPISCFVSVHRCLYFWVGRPVDNHWHDMSSYVLTACSPLTGRFFIPTDGFHLALLFTHH